MKKSKKFVLAALVLLAITGLLPLAGCKNDSVPPEVEKQEQGDGGGSETDKNNTTAKLVSISVIPPTRTVYSVEQEFDSTGMKVTATYDDKSQREVTGWETDFNTVATEKGLGKEVTISYTEGDTTETGTFTVDVASYQFTETVQNVDSSYTGTMTDGTYKKFGDWPQTIKEEGVEIGTGTLVMGGLIYHVGSDGNYYVKVTAKPSTDIYTYTYSNKVPVEKDKEVYFEVEPIVWRVLTPNFTASEGGNALLLAESILAGVCYYDFDRTWGSLEGEEWSGHRVIEGKTILPNNYEHSQIRAWLNGLSYQSQEREGAALSAKDEYKNAGFLQTAFTANAQLLIAPTIVDNSTANTTDKIFLLSEEEATNSEYGFAEYNVYVGDLNDTTTSTRIRVSTDYAKATGANQDSKDGYGGWWWLRSPCSDNERKVRTTTCSGQVNSDGYVLYTSMGVVPALSISLPLN